MHFAIRYLTEYRYEAPVSDNLNALRVMPATTRTQRVDDFGVRVDPESRLHQHLDYFGTTVIEFGVSRPHDHLSIDVRARVKTTPPDDPPEAAWSDLDGRAYGVEAGEFLLPVGDEPDDLVLDELVGVSRAESPLATVQRMVGVIPDRFEYRPGVTYVGSTVGDLLAAGAGVCQDFAHLALLLLRRHASPRATSRATCGHRRTATRTPTRPRSTRTRGSRRWSPATASRSGCPPTPRTARSAARAT